MPKTPESVRTNPTVLCYRGLDLDALTSIQMRNIERIRRMSTVLFDSIEMVAARQIDFLKSTGDQARTLFDAGEAKPGAAMAFGERQAAIHRELFATVTKHAGELTEIATRCCGGMIEQLGVDTFTSATSRAIEEPPAKTTE